MAETYFWELKITERFAEYQKIPQPEEPQPNQNDMAANYGDDGDGDNFDPDDTEPV